MPRWSLAPSSLICLDGSNEPAGPQIYPHFLAGTEPVCLRPRAIPPQHDGEPQSSGCPGAGCSKDEQGKSQLPQNFPS